MLPYHNADTVPHTEKLSNIVRSVSIHSRSTDTPTPTQWDSQTVRDRPPSSESGSRAASRDPSRRNNSTAGLSHTGSHTASSRESRDSRERMDRYALPSRNTHRRNDSEATGISSGYSETSQGGGPLRRHDYDVQAMEASLLSPRASVSRNPVPAPVISVRSEFPTINRSRQQQTLTCLITVEVPDNNWIPDPDDLRTAPAAPSVKAEEKYERPPSPAQSAPRFYPYESPEVLESITENLHERVENWHGLDFSK